MSSPSTDWDIWSQGDEALGESTAAEVARDQLRSAVLAPECAGALAQVLHELDTHGADLARRTCRPGHLTGSALVVDESDGRVLVLFHRKLRRWLQPGGHADGDTNLAHVAWREATEETSIPGLRVVTPAIDLDVHTVEHGDELGTHLHLDLRFLVLAPGGSVPRGNHESEDLRWVDRRRLEELADEAGILRLADAGLGVLGELTAT